MDDRESFNKIASSAYQFKRIQSLDDLADNWSFLTKTVELIDSSDDPARVVDNLNSIIDTLHSAGVDWSTIYHFLEEEPREAMLEHAALKDLEADSAIEYMVKYGDEGFQLVLDSAYRAVYGIS